jgi:hypothetical protein
VREDSLASRAPETLILDLDRAGSIACSRRAVRVANLARLYRYVLRAEGGTGRALARTDFARFLAGLRARPRPGSGGSSRRAVRFRRGARRASLHALGCRSRKRLRSPRKGSDSPPHARASWDRVRAWKPPGSPGRGPSWVVVRGPWRSRGSSACSRPRPSRSSPISSGPSARAAGQLLARRKGVQARLDAGERPGVLPGDGRDPRRVVEGRRGGPAISATAGSRSPDPSTGR